MQRYNGTASDEDAPVAVAVNESLNVYVGEKKNPKLSLYNNHLLGELMMLKLNIAARDAEITPPRHLAILFMMITIPPSLQRKTLRQLTILVDNLITYWKKYPSGSINWSLFDSMLTRVNRAFTRPLGMVSLVISGVTHIDSVAFLDRRIHQQLILNLKMALLIFRRNLYWSKTIPIRSLRKRLLVFRCRR